MMIDYTQNNVNQDPISIIHRCETMSQSARQTKTPRQDTQTTEEDYNDRNRLYISY